MHWNEMVYIDKWEPMSGLTYIFDTGYGNIPLNYNKRSLQCQQQSDKTPADLDMDEPV